MLLNLKAYQLIYTFLNKKYSENYVVMYVNIKSLSVFFKMFFKTQSLWGEKKRDTFLMNFSAKEIFIIKCI